MASDMALGRRFQSVDLTDERAPYCPLNGHEHRCDCPPCTAFWESPLGSLVASWTRDLAREIGDW